MDSFGIIGYWVCVKFRARAKKHGYFATATSLRKQGIPLEVALMILVNKL